MQLYKTVSFSASRMVTMQYSTSFSIGSLLLDAESRKAIYGIYGFVRLTDEIVDTFHGFDKAKLLQEFQQDTWASIGRKISLNPILHSFQYVVNQYGIREEYIGSFFKSMESDLRKTAYNRANYEEYIVGSAEVVGLMCLQVFCKGDEKRFEALQHPARKLGAAFQKVNFLRDLKEDWEQLGRLYFPGVEFSEFNETTKSRIEKEINQDFREALEGIKSLPRESKLGVYVAYVYYLSLFRRIKNKPARELITSRIRVPNYQKLLLLVKSYLQLKLNLL